jgi:hypothetical protein
MTRPRVVGWANVTRRGRRCVNSSRETGLLEPQHEFLDFGGTRLSEASFGRDDAKAALLEDTVRRDVMVSDARVERARFRDLATLCDAFQQLVVQPGNEGWSLYGAQRLQPVATSGKCDAAGNGSDKRKPLPWVATDCLRRSMVRRGSTVRVRQRASQKARKAAGFLSRLVALSPACVRYGALYGAFRSRRRSWSREPSAETSL